KGIGTADAAIYVVGGALPAAGPMIESAPTRWYDSGKDERRLPRGASPPCGIPANPRKWRAFDAKRVHFIPNAPSGSQERLALCSIGAAVTNMRICWRALAGN